MLVEVSKGQKVAAEDLGYTEHVGDTKFAGKIARDVYNHWDNEVWRNAFIFALGDYCENQVLAHKDELEAMIQAAHKSTVEKARRAIIKSYAVSKARSVRVDDYTRGDGTHVSGYTAHRVGAARRVPAGDDHAEALGAMINAYNARVAPGQGDKGQTIAYHISGPEGDRVAIHTSSQTPHVGPDEKITHVQSLGIINPTLSGHHAYNLATALGADAAHAGSAGAVVQGVADAGKGKDWFERLTSMSKTLHYATGGPVGPVPIQVATAMGEAVGQHGPEVARVLGPGIRRYSYKYRGMTAAPAQFSDTARQQRQTDTQGNKETVEAFERKLVGVLASTDRAKGGLAAIPTDEQNRLLLQSGSTAPSQGFILDARGKAVQQAVGHADDHYVPFNLHRLGALKNGSYVRSRAYGGPTTEDLSLAMRSGASRVTTVSRHGSYTIQFDPRANTKRWGYTPRQVTNRYGRLLDAIKSGRVRDPNNTAETLKLDAHGYDVALQSLKHQYPFLIQAVYHTPASQMPELEGRRAGSGEEDTGYVRPMYLKPQTAMAGYHDSKLGGARSYDDLEGYRSLKATKILLDQKLAADQRAREAQRPVYGASAADIRAQRERSGSVAPSGVSQRERERSDAAATETGAPVRSYAMRDAVWDQEQHTAMMDTVQDLLRHYIGQNFKDGDYTGTAAGAEMARRFEDLKAGDQDALDWSERIRTNEGGAREDLLTDINDLYEDYAGEDPFLVTRLKRIEDGLHENIGDKYEEASDEEYVPQVNSAGVESLASLQKDPDYNDWDHHDLMTKWKNDPNLGEKKRKQVEAWFNTKVGDLPEDEQKDYPLVDADDNYISRGDYWDNADFNLTNPHPADEAYTPAQQMARRIARAKGQNPPTFGVKEEEVDPRPVATTTEDMSEEEKNRIAQEYAEREFREMEERRRQQDDDWS